MAERNLYQFSTENDENFYSILEDDFMLYDFAENFENEMRSREENEDACTKQVIFYHFNIIIKTHMKI